MPVMNNQSVQRGLRIKIPHDEHLQRKARANPANPHNNVGTEINLLIEADFEKSKAKKKK